MLPEWKRANPVSTRPIVVGVEQEVPVYRVFKENGREITKKIHQITAGFMHDFIMDFIRECYPHSLYWYKEGVAVRDGRIYQDVGQLELSTAECMNPFELATRISSMREKLREYLIFLEGTHIAYCDSAGREHSTSFHENYYSSLCLNQLEGLTNFLYSRIVLTGTGGPSEKVLRNNFYLCLSPRLGRTYDLIGIRETDLDGMARVHVTSSDQIMSPATIALQVGITAFAIRLHELGQLPIPDNLFNISSENVNSHVPGREDETFVKAVCFQRAIYKESRAYAAMCREEGFSRIFGDEESLEYFFALWDRRLDLLEQYCKDWKLAPLTEEFEWAVKAELVYSLREREDRDITDPLTAKEMWLCSEFTSFIPATKKIEQLQRPFLYCDDSYRDIFFIPRAAARAQIIALAAECDDQYLVRYMDWTGVMLESPRKLIDLSTPFHGLNEIDPSVCLSANRPQDFRRFVADAEVVIKASPHIEPSLVLR